MSVIVVCAVGLTLDHLGSATPALSALAGSGAATPLTPSLPAVTTTAQTTMLTGADPSAHGIVANGWYFRDLGEVWLWRQSEGLIEAPYVWIQGSEPPPRVLKHFWWYAMNTACAATVTPRPAYHADGRKSPDIYAWPAALHDELVAAHGPFPLFHFWGPLADIRSSRWIADSFVTAWKRVQPDLALCYLPHLDYDLQRLGPHGPHLAANLTELDHCVATVLDHAKAVGARIVVVSEYGIEAATTAVFVNRRLREVGLLEVQVNATGELLDPGASRAFAVCDHQAAHIYCADTEAADRAHSELEQVRGIERLYRGADRQAIGLDHPRSGEIVAVAAPGAWFAYDYWLDDARRPDFANHVEIHRKPGYDPRELAFDPRGGKRRAFTALVRKRLGLRYRMNAIGLDPAVVRGSHGRPPSRPDAGPVLLVDDGDLLPSASPHQRDVAGLLQGLLRCSQRP